jgi:cytosine/uracil/thiamine/allantoin permease
MICVTAICGILITSAAEKIYGTYLWNPFELVLTIQQESLTAGARAGTFFAGLGFLSSQLALCIILNCVNAGMDLAVLCPKWINIRRGSYLVSVIAIAILPWNYVTEPTTFIYVLSGVRLSFTDHRSCSDQFLPCPWGAVSSWGLIHRKQLFSLLVYLWIQLARLLLLG